MNATKPKRRRPDAAQAVTIRYAYLNNPTPSTTITFTFSGDPSNLALSSIPDTITLASAQTLKSIQISGSPLQLVSMPGSGAIGDSGFWAVWTDYAHIVIVDKNYTM